jgi:hypothetical protein
MKVFVSTENTNEERVAEIIGRLKACPGLELDHSPADCSLGRDERWRTWYAQGCAEAIARADCFVALQSRGYASSTWMLIELDTAWKRWLSGGRPRLFLSRSSARALPRGFAPYERDAIPLPSEAEALVASFLRHVG